MPKRIEKRVFRLLALCKIKAAQQISCYQNSFQVFAIIFKYERYDKIFGHNSSTAHSSKPLDIDSIACRLICDFSLELLKKASLP